MNVENFSGKFRIIYSTRYLNDLTGHSNIPGNFRGDKLARRVTTIEFSDEFSILTIVIIICVAVGGEATVQTKYGNRYDNLCRRR